MTEEEKCILALLPYLDHDQAEIAHDMLQSGQSLDEINIYVNDCIVGKTKKRITDRVIEPFQQAKKKYLPVSKYPPSVRQEMEYTEYIKEVEKKDPKAAEWAKQFYHEYYTKGGYQIEEKDRIIKDKDLRKEANRNNNILMRDALVRSRNRQNLYPIEDRQETASDDYTEYTWEDIFRVHGYEAAVKQIVEEAKEEFEINKLDLTQMLVRFYIKMERLRRLNNADIKARAKTRKAKDGHKPKKIANGSKVNPTGSGRKRNPSR